MPTATKTKPETETVTFVARCMNQEVVIEPRRPVYERDGGGNVVNVHYTPGKRCVFKNWTFETDDAQTIEYLRNHSQFDTPHGWKEAYDASRPSVVERAEAIARLAASGDKAGLLELIRSEESAGDGGRSDVLGPAHAALEAVESDSGAEAAGTSQRKKKSAEKSEAASDPPADSE